MPLQRGQKIGDERKKGATNKYLGQRRFSFIRKKEVQLWYNLTVMKTREHNSYWV